MVLSEAARSLILIWSCVKEESVCQQPRGRERPDPGSSTQGAAEARAGPSANQCVRPHGGGGRLSVSLT